MNFDIFKNLVDTLEKVLSGLKVLAGLPKAERDRIRQTMSETYQLIDSGLNMVIVRLGDIRRLENEQTFLNEVENLDNYDDWLSLERHFRLCESLRTALRETENLRQQITGPISTKDWDALLNEMQAMLATEGELAMFISDRFRDLANAARGSAANADSLRQDVRKFREALAEERHRLINQEIELHNII